MVTKELSLQVEIVTELMIMFLKHMHVRKNLGSLPKSNTGIKKICFRYVLCW